MKNPAIFSMSAVDEVTQRNASAAEELSSTAEEMASQAEALQRLMAFFAIREEAGARRRLHVLRAPEVVPAPRPEANAASAAPAPGGFKRF